MEEALDLLSDRLLNELVSNNFDVSRLDYVSVSAQMQEQNAMWLLAVRSEV